MTLKIVRRALRTTKHKRNTGTPIPQMELRNGAAV